MSETPNMVKRPAAPTLLKNLSRPQIMHLGNTVYGLELVVAPTIKKDVMVDDVAAAMQMAAGCGCSGENVPCHPEIHRFSPDIFGLPQDIGSLGTTQNDIPVSGGASAFGDASLPPAAPPLPRPPACTVRQQPRPRG